MSKLHVFYFHNTFLPAREGGRERETARERRESASEREKQPRERGH